MCTALTFSTRPETNIFGRTMDFSYDIEPELIVIPRNYSLYNSFTSEYLTNKYSFIGIGQETDNILGFFDGVNERGLAGAALYFAGYANYNLQHNLKSKKPIPSIIFLHFLLGACATIDEIKKIINNFYVVGVPDPVTNIAAPLHWIFTDISGSCIVIEQTDKGLELFDNSIGVLANSPDFNWHMTNLRNYTELNIAQKEESVWNNIELSPFGQGGGSMLLPGGYTSPERFVRTAFLKSHSIIPENNFQAINTAFQLVKSVSIPKGIILTHKGTYDYTIYTAFINTRTQQYFFNTSQNNQIAAVPSWKNYTNNLKPVFLGKLDRPIKFEKFV